MATLDESVAFFGWVVSDLTDEQIAFAGWSNGASTLAVYPSVLSASTSRSIFAQGSTKRRISVTEGSTRV